MANVEDEEELLRSVTLQNARSILLARRRAEEELQKQSEWLRVTLASIGDAVITTDGEGRVTSLNRVATALTGWSQDDAAGRPLSEVFRIVNEETRQPVENPIKTVLAKGNIVGLANHTVLIAKDETERPIDDSAAPIRDAAGNVLGVVLIFRDIAARRDAEEAMRRSEQRFRSLVIATAQIVWTTDAAGQVVEDSPSWRAFTGQTYDEWRGWGWLDAIHPDDRERTAEIWRRSVADKTICETEYRVRTADGSYRWTAVRAIPVLEADGRIREWVGMNTDITARKQAEEDLKEAGRRKDEFLAMLAHELRNPLAPIRNALQLIRLKGGGEREPAMEMMERQVGQIVRLVDDLLDVSRVSRGNIELRKEQVELAAIVNHAVEAAGPPCERMEQELSITLPSQPIYLDADPIRLAQVVENLLNNACKFTPRSGRVRLTVEREGEYAVLRVRDSGIGIAADQLSRIFEMFVQVDTSLERTQGGLGIGLTLVKNLVEMHGGTVEARSPGAGLGSEFVVRLPVLTAYSRLAPREPPAAKPTLPRRILVVDDNRDAAESLAMLLKLSGHEVHTAHDGLDAVEAAAKFKPDVILLDLGLPKLNGYEAARRIRERRGDVVLVALTGWGQEKDRRRSAEAGFDTHIVKPVDYNALTKLLEKWCAS